LNVLATIPYGEIDSGSHSRLLTCGKHATVHEAVVAFALVGGKVGLDVDSLESILLQQRPNGFGLIKTDGVNAVAD